MKKNIIIAIVTFVLFFILGYVQPAPQVQPDPMDSLYAEYEAWAAVTPVQCSNINEKRIQPATLGGFVTWLEENKK
jgi:hypothetical protein